MFTDSSSASPAGRRVMEGMSPADSDRALGSAATRSIPAGYTALVAVAPAGRDMWQGAMVLTKKAVPSCVSLPAAAVTRTGDSGVKSTIGSGGESGLATQTKP